MTKQYKVTITETSKMNVFVEAESQLEAEQKVADAWKNGEYILDADNFVDVDYEAEDMTPKRELHYGEMTGLFIKLNEKGLPPAKGYIVFTSDSFENPYREESRTYEISSADSAFKSDLKECSLHGSCLDGTDQNICLDRYMKISGGWKIEKCYLLDEDYNRITKELGLSKDRPLRQVER